MPEISRKKTESLHRHQLFLYDAGLRVSHRHLYMASSHSSSPEDQEALNDSQPGYDYPGEERRVCSQLLAPHPSFRDQKQSGIGACHTEEFSCCPSKTS